MAPNGHVIWWWRHMQTKNTFIRLHITDYSEITYGVWVHSFKSFFLHEFKQWLIMNHLFSIRQTFHYFGDPESADLFCQIIANHPPQLSILCTNSTHVLTVTNWTYCLDEACNVLFPLTPGKQGGQLHLNLPSAKVCLKSTKHEATKTRDWIYEYNFIHFINKTTWCSHRKKNTIQQLTLP
jgi:hypothetical protein